MSLVNHIKMTSIFALTIGAKFSFCQVKKSPIENAVFDESLWPSARAASLSGAIATTANGMDAAYYNPAAIGGIEVSSKRPIINQLHFPYFAVAVNNDTMKLKRDLSKVEDLNNEAIVNQILRTQQGKRQYGRVSIVPNIVFWRTMIAYVYDTQVAAAAEDSNSTEVSVISRTVKGPSLGFSFKDPSQRFYFGMHAGFYQRDVVAGTFAFTDLSTPETRKSQFKDNRQEYVGAPLNIGAVWVLAPHWRPSLGLVFRNAGDTKYRNTDEAQEDLLVEEDATLSFSLNPSFRSWGALHLTLEGDSLTQTGSSLHKKLKSSLEWTWGSRYGAESITAFRVGYNVAGISYGTGINLGIIGLNLASSVEDVGVNNIRVVERRTHINFAVNVADF